MAGRNRRRIRKSEAQLAASGLLTLEQINKFLLAAESANPRIAPLMIDGKPYYVMFPADRIPEGLPGTVKYTHADGREGVAFPTKVGA